MPLNNLTLSANSIAVNTAGTISISGTSSGTKLSLLNDGEGIFSINGNTLVYAAKPGANRTVGVSIREFDPSNFQSNVTNFRISITGALAEGPVSEDAKIGEEVATAISRVGIVELRQNSGETDWAAAIERAATAASAQGSIVQAPANGTLNLSRTVNTGTSSFSLNLNGSRLIPPANGMAMVNPSQRVAYTDGAYFTSTLGAMSFTPPAAMATALNNGSVRVTDVIRFRSNSVRVANGSYLHGMWARLIGWDGATAYIDRPFYAAFVVDRIDVITPCVITISNGTIDCRGQVRSGANAPGGIQLTGDTIRYQNVNAYGANDSGVALAGSAMLLEAEGCNGGGFLDLSATTSRIGYFLSGDGDKVVFKDGTGWNCKHVLTTANRLWWTREVHYDRFSAYSPAGSESQTDNVSGNPLPVYQAPIDVHASVGMANITGCTVGGVNSLIAIRNQAAVLVGNTLLPVGTGVSANPPLIDLYEEAKTSVVIEDTVVRSGTATGKMPYFVGTNNFELTFDNVTVRNVYHESITGSNDLGMVFIYSPGTGSTQFASRINKFTADGFVGPFKDGFNQGSGSQPVDGISELTIMNMDVQMIASADTNARFYREGKPASLTNGGQRRTTAADRATVRLTGRNRINTDLAPAQEAFVLGRGDSFLPRLRISDDTVLELGGRGILINTPLADTAIPTPEIHATFLNARTATGAANVEAIASYLDSGRAFDRPADLRGAVFVSGAGTTTGRKNWLFLGGTSTTQQWGWDGVTCNTGAVLPSVATRPPVPVGYRRSDVVEPALPSYYDSMTIDISGQLYAAAQPTVTYLPAGKTVLSTSSAAAGPSGWQYSGATNGWRALAARA